MPDPEIHFTLRPGKPENQTPFMPEWYYNVDKSFVIPPTKLIDIFLCSKPFADSSLCLISTKEACVVSLQLYNNSLTKKIKIPRKTSLQKLMQYSLIRTHSLTVYDKTCSRSPKKTYILK